MRRETNTGSEAAGQRRFVVFALLMILVLTFVSYLDALWFKFVLDDRYQIVDNTWLRSWSYLPRYFTADVWAFRHPSIPGNLYRPLFLVWLRLHYVLFGLNPWGWHLTTVLAHVGVTFLVYLLAFRLLKDELAAIFAALIFGVYPGHLEAVAWVAGVTEPLLALLMIPAFLCYLNKREGYANPRLWLGTSLALYGLAMLAKETAIMLPMIIFASEWIWTESGEAARSHAWLKKARAASMVVVPYILLTGAYVALRMLALHGFQNPREPESLLTMALTWPSALWFYFRHLVWPANLGPFYDMGYVSHPGLRNFLLPGIAILAVAAALWKWGSKSKKAALAMVWLALPILPVLNLQVTGKHDRYLYLPSVGFAMLVALALRKVKWGQAKLFGQPVIQISLVCVLGGVLAVSTSSQNVYYANEDTFYLRLNSMTTDSDLAKMNVANLLGETGRFQEAVKLYQEILQHRPDAWELHYNVGYADYLMGKLAEAEQHLTRATELNPADPDSYFYLGLTELKLGRADQAAADVRRAILIRPDTDNYHFALGVILKSQGNFRAALEEFRAEVALNPQHPAAREQISEVEAALAKGKPGATGRPDTPAEPSPNKP
jgi:tetratricopeptide (TPR) repeat protein